MIHRSEDRQTTRTEGVKGGEGHMLSRPILPVEQLCGKGRLYSVTTLEKDCGVGWHVHEGDTESYFVLSGEGEFNDNGVVTTLRPGDVAFTDEGEGHSIVNRGDEPLVVLALILYK